MILSLDRWLERETGLGRVEVLHVDPAIPEKGNRLDVLHMLASRIDLDHSGYLRAILATDEPGEVGEMCEAQHICSLCKQHFARKAPCTCEQQVGSTRHRPVTHRLYLWRGQEVEWRELFRLCPRCGGSGSVEDIGYGHACGGDLERCPHTCPVPEQIQVQCDCYGGWLDLERPLTAVILCASDPIPVERVREAKAACDEAGVQLVIAEWNADALCRVCDEGGNPKYEDCTCAEQGDTTLDGQDLSRLELT